MCNLEKKKKKKRSAQASTSPVKKNAELKDGEVSSSSLLSSHCRRPRRRRVVRNAASHSEKGELFFPSSEGMAPSVDCIAASLYCAEEDVSSGSAWDHDDDDEEGKSKRTVELHRRLTDSMEAPVVLLDFPVEDDDAISMLMHKEARSMPEADYSGTFLSHHLHAEARQNAIRWMLKVLGFLLQCVTEKCNRDLLAHPDRHLSSSGLACLGFGDLYTTQEEKEQSPFPRDGFTVEYTSKKNKRVPCCSAAVVAPSSR